VPVDSLYFSVITLATVGYGDLAPVTTAGKLFTIIYILVGIGLFVAVARHLATGLATSRSKKVAARKRERAKGQRDEEREDL
jgi:voltage-gated potassium channel